MPLRTKTGYGLVIESHDAGDLKSDIKSRAYAIKKIGEIKAENFLLPGFIKATHKIADYFASSIGAVMSVLIPKTILEQSDSPEIFVHENTTDLEKTRIENNAENKTAYFETLILQAENEERYATYRSLIREEFARGKSVFFCLPTVEDLHGARELLEKGIEKFTFVLHAGLRKKEISRIWKEVLIETHPVVVIATGAFLSLPRADIGTIILEKESSRSYKIQTRPYLDFRQVALFLAEENGQKIIFGDTMMRIETLWREKNGDYQNLAPLKFRSLSTASCRLLDMRRPATFPVSKEPGGAATNKKKEFAVFDPELIKILSEAIENNEHTFLFAGRKGLSPTTVCDDCGTTVSCGNCGAPMILYSSDRLRLASDKKNSDNTRKNLFVCHRCGERRDASELCVHCRGWRLSPLGIGTDRVLSAFEELFPGRSAMVLDKERAATRMQAIKIRDVFYSSPGAVLIGTEMSLPYLFQKIENSAVVSIDSFFSIPDFRIHEKIFQILLSLRSLSDKQFLIQTRQAEDSPGHKILDYALRGNLFDFYRDEIEEREQIGLPPFTTHIKISLEGEKTAVRKKMAELSESLKPRKLLTFDAFAPGKAKKFTVNGLLSITGNSWIDPALLETLRKLPPEFSIRVDPDTLL